MFRYINRVRHGKKIYNLKSNLNRGSNSVILVKYQNFWSFGSSSSSSSSSSSNNDSKNENSSNINGTKQPYKQGVFDEAPRYPHLIGLPVQTRPLFPGILHSMLLTDEATINAIEKSPSTMSNGYIGTFLRKSTKESESSEILTPQPPEIITSPDELYTIGTLAQVIRIQRNVDHSGVASASMNHHNLLSSLQQNQFTNKLNLGETSTTTTQATEEEGEDQSPISASVLLLAHRRINLISIDNIGPPIDVTVQHWDKLQYNTTTTNNSKKHDTIRALTNEIFSTVREIAQMNPIFREQLQFISNATLRGVSQYNLENNPFRVADFVASVCTGTPEELQSILEETDAEMRLHKALSLLLKEKDIMKLQQEISSKVEEKMTDTQRKYFLNEQLKSIKKELGMEYDDKDAIMKKYQENIKDKTIPKEASDVIQQEMNKLSTLEKNSGEFNITRNYLDWLTSIPWGVYHDELFDLSLARKILNADHYGLDDVKDIILQFIAIGKLKGTIQGKILCLVGPPGVGKSSIASSVAQALNREFYRFSVGGLGDVSEIKGHRRTYIGAMPGKLIQCLKSTKSMNPLILIDEIDKLAYGGHRGDPASALLEVLDPNQNENFMDHYLDVSVDLSQVLFMCTANEIDRIPGPLLDRMEIVRLSGYDVPEKIAIAEQYLVPKSMLESGLFVQKEQEIKEEDTEEKKEIVKPELVKGENIPESLQIETSAIQSLVRWYAREAGVRNLSKYIDRITRKLALQVVAESSTTTDFTLTEKSRRKSDTWTITSDNLSDYVGKPIFTTDRLFDRDLYLPRGVVMGLAWTSMGGSALYVETKGLKKKENSGGNLKVTGQLGDVMNESTQIAFTVAKSRIAENFPDNTFFDDHDMHIHVPEGATPKDGPSAGITIITAMLSQALCKPIPNDLAMTGEVSLTEKVLPVGGIKEKTMAARRAGIKRIIFPFANKRDFDELPDYLKDGIEVFYAEDYHTVFDIAFGHETQADDGSNPTK